MHAEKAGTIANIATCAPECLCQVRSARCLRSRACRRYFQQYQSPSQQWNAETVTMHCAPLYPTIAAIVGTSQESKAGTGARSWPSRSLVHAASCAVRITGIGSTIYRVRDSSARLFCKHSYRISPGWQSLGLWRAPRDLHPVARAAVLTQDATIKRFRTAEPHRQSSFNGLQCCAYMPCPFTIWKYHVTGSTEMSHQTCLHMLSSGSALVGLAVCGRNDTLPHPISTMA